MNDELIEVMARAMLADTQNPDDPELDVALQKCFEEHAQAAIDALKAEGWMLVRWESWTKERDAELAYVEDMGFLAGVEPPAAALVGRKDEPT